MNFKKSNQTPIFVIGTGRSGTHLLGKLFYSSPEVHVFIEDKKFFSKITNLATGLDVKTNNIYELINNYKKEFNKINKMFVLEKTHPNIWFVEQLEDAFPDAKFIGIKRDVYATVASMLNHKGVLKWYELLSTKKVNRFLGINEDNVSYFENLPLEAKCALRWKSHTEQLNYLENKFPDKVMILDYKDFYDNKNSLMNKISDFVGLQTLLKCEPLNKNGLLKWKETLSKEMVVNIDNVLIP